MSLSGRDATVSIPPEQVSDWVRQNQIGTYLGVVLATVVLYDAICTFDKEVKYFWNGSRFGMTKAVFFLNRYCGIFGALIIIIFYTQNPTLTECNLANWGSDFSRSITIISIDWSWLCTTMTMRRMTIFLSALLSIEAITKVVLIVLGLRAEGMKIVGLASNLTTCGGASFVPAYIYILDWTLPLAYGTLLLTLALFKAADLWRLNGFHGRRLVFVLIKDQAFYYTLAISCSIFNILNNTFGTSLVPAAVLSALGSPTLLCILGSRMFFNLKEAGEHGVNVGTNWSSHSHSAIRFDDPQHEEQSTVSAIAFDEPQSEDGGHPESNDIEVGTSSAAGGSA